MGPVWQNPIQRTLRTTHLSVLMTVHSFSTQYKTEQFWLSPLLPPDKHHSSDVVCWRRGGHDTCIPSVSHNHEQIIKALEVKCRQTICEGHGRSFLEYKVDKRILRCYQRPLWLARSWRRIGKEPTSQKTLGSRGSSSICCLFMSNRNRHNTQSIKNSPTGLCFRLRIGERPQEWTWG